MPVGSRLTSGAVIPVRTSDLAIAPIRSHPEGAAMTEKTPVDHPLNCRCRKCRYDED